MAPQAPTISVSVPPVVDEESPLLMNSCDDMGDRKTLKRDDDDDHDASRRASSQRIYLSASSRTVIQLCILTLIFDFTQYSVYAPLTALFEDIICSRYYSSLAPSALLSAQRDCKVYAVQHELAVVKGYKDTFNQIPSILLGIPLGLLADRIGRRPIIMLFLLGFFLCDSWVKVVCLFPEHLPLRLVWLSPLFKIIGGGANFGTSMLFTAAADVVAEKDRVDVFLKMSAMEMIVQIAAAPMVSTMMTFSNWYPLVLSSLLLVVAGFVAFLLPETRPPQKQQRPSASSSSSRAAPSDESWLQMTWTLMLRSMATSRRVLTSPVILLALGVFVLAAWGAHVWALLLQFVSQKFEWEFSTANLLFSLRGVITLLLSLFIVQAIDKFIQEKLGIKSARKDLLLSIGSCVLIILGITSVGLAQNASVMVAGVAISALGSSLLVSFRCAMISLFQQVPVASLNAICGIAQSIGILISGPTLAAIYSWGLRQGGVWLGTPFIFASLLHVVVLGVMFYLLVAQAGRRGGSQPSSSRSTAAGGR
ncbi:major facilitator superfamily domain-containing protein [Cladorrhinum sp. PSN259]|nr:major facilitator superfamily domain-containing protein [Cladorrhinum sp. PSN259]